MIGISIFRMQQSILAAEKQAPFISACSIHLSYEESYQDSPLLS